MTNPKKQSFDAESGPAPAARAGPSALTLWEVTGYTGKKVRTGEHLQEVVGPVNAKAK